VLAVGIAAWIGEHESLGGEFRFIAAGTAHGGDDDRWRGY
jgi:hypothetical protein